MTVPERDSFRFLRRPSPPARAGTGATRPASKVHEPAAGCTVLAVKVLLVVVVAVMVVVLFDPALGRGILSSLRPTEALLVPTESGEMQELTIVTLLGFDAIPAILEPDFVSVQVASAWMDPGEQVLGVSINGDHRAYSVPMLSRHEIVNDVVGGVPIAVTW